MSFKPFDFTFTPPATVPTTPPASTPAPPSGPVVGPSPTTGANSNAGQIISALDDLTAMSQYLQDTIVSRTGKTAIEVVPASDPNTAMALARIYNTDQPVPFVTISMYDQLLDAHLGALQLDMISTGTTIQPNPIQVGDLMQIVGAIDKSLINDPSYKNWLPLQLSSLKVDTIAFQSWKASLQTYPAYYAAQTLVPGSLRPSIISAASLDLSPDLASFELSSVNHFAKSYSDVYQAMASVNAVESDLNSVMNEYINQPLGNILRILSMFNALKGFAHKTSMSNLQGDLINYAFARMASDATSMLHTADQMVALSVAPLHGTMGSLGRIVAGVQQQAAEVGFLSGGGLSGLAKTNACAQNNPANKIKGGKPLNIPGLGQISDGLKALAETIDWAGRKAESGLATVDKSFRQLLSRRMKAQDDRNELMCSMRALDALVGITSGVFNEFQKGTLTQNASPQQRQEAANRILTSLQASSDTTFTTDNGQIIANPPDMPPASPPVQRVLSRAKIRTTLGRIEA